MIRFARVVLILAATTLATACELPLGACDDMLRPNLSVEVRDAATGAPLGLGATGLAVHQGGDFTELTSGWDSLRLHGNWSREQPGRYSVMVRKPGYAPGTHQSRVSSDACHVRTQRVDVRLQRDPRQVAVAPSELRLQPHVIAHIPAAEVRVVGQTLEISGMAMAPCSSLQAVAYRSAAAGGPQWHIQFEPEVWAALGTCRETAVMQPFVARYELVPGANQVLVTTAAGFPTVLFERVVQGT